MIAVSANVFLARAQDESFTFKPKASAAFKETQVSPVELDELLALSPAEAADLERDLAFERASSGELHVARFPAQAAN